MNFYFSMADYRADMRNPCSAARAHAICRRLVGCEQKSLWYGAHYWAACAVTSYQKKADSFYRDAFYREVTGGYKELPPMVKSLWKVAFRRVKGIAVEARKLEHSMLW